MESQKEEVPVFTNDAGEEEIKVSVRIFGCMGVSPPFDHPHVYFNMEESDLVVCSYCSTRFVYQT